MSPPTLIFLLLAISSQIRFGDSYRILAIFPFPVRSHFDVFKPMLMALSERDHEVTVISYFPSNGTNYKDISLVGTENLLVNSIPFSRFTQSRFEKYLVSWFLYKMSSNVCDSALKSSEFVDFLTRKDKFDLVLVEYFTTNCFLGLLDHESVPIIGLSSCTYMPWVSDYFALPENPAFIPSIFMDYNHKMSFVQRLENSLLYIFNRVMYKVLIDRHANQKAREHFGNRIELDKIAYNSSMILTNTHHTLHQARALVPQTVEVGGLHITKGQKLPQVNTFFDVQDDLYEEAQH